MGSLGEKEVFYTRLQSKWKGKERERWWWVGEALAMTRCVKNG